MDIKTTVAELLSKTKNALLEIVNIDKPFIIEAVDTYIKNAEERFSSLLSNLSENGDISFLLARLKDEKDILESEVLSFLVIGKGAAQDIINSVQNIVLSAVAEVLPNKEI